MRSSFVFFTCVSIFCEVAGITPMNPASRQVHKRKVNKLPESSPGETQGYKIHRLVEQISSDSLRGDGKFLKHTPIEQNSYNRKSTMNGYGRPQIDWVRALMEGPQYSNFRQAMPKQLQQNSYPTQPISAQNLYQSQHQPPPTQNLYQHQLPPLPDTYHPSPAPQLQELYLPPYTTRVPHHPRARQNSLETVAQPTEGPSQLHLPTANVVHTESPHNASSPLVHRRLEIQGENDKVEKNEAENEAPEKRDNCQKSNEEKVKSEKYKNFESKAEEQSEEAQRKSHAQTTIYEAIIIPKQIDKKEINELISMIADMSGKRILLAAKEGTKNNKNDRNKEKARNKGEKDKDDTGAEDEKDTVDMEGIKRENDEESNDDKDEEDNYYEEDKADNGEEDKKEDNDDNAEEDKGMRDNSENDDDKEVAVNDKEQDESNNSEEDKTDKEKQNTDNNKKYNANNAEENVDDKGAEGRDHIGRKVIDVKESIKKDDDNGVENAEIAKNNISQEQKENLLTDKIIAFLKAAAANGPSPIDVLGKIQKGLLIPAP